LHGKSGHVNPAKCSHPLKDFGNKERKNKKHKGEYDFPAYEIRPMAACPDVLHCPNKKGEDEGADDDTECRPGKIIPKTHPGQPHAEVHRRKREIDKAQIEYGCKAISLDGVIVFFQLVPDE